MEEQFPDLLHEGSGNKEHQGWPTVGAVLRALTPGQHGALILPAAGPVGCQQL